MGQQHDLCEAIEWWLWQTNGVGLKTMLALEAACDGDFASLTSQTRLEAVLTEASVPANIRRRLSADDLAEAPDALHEERESLPARSRILWHRDAGFPTRLEELSDPPRFLYVRGRAEALDDPSTVAMVGSRSARVEGIRHTREIASGLAEDGHVVVSGGAIGVDAAAHTGAVEAGRPTAVILPGGIDKPSPQKNSRVFRRALEHGGCLVSEYPLGSPVRKHHFHRRNRLIAALGDWLVVVRAGKRSGTMITARAAAELERPILTMAGAADDSRFAGCVDLLAAGAGCVRGSDDVLRVLGHPGSPQRFRVEPDLIARSAKKTGKRRASKQPANVQVDQKLRAKLGVAARDALALIEEVGQSGPAHADELRRKWGQSDAGLETALLELELVGVVQKAAGKNAYVVAK